MQAGIISATREIVDVAKAAKLMGMPERTARHWAETGKIEAAVTASAWGGGAGGKAYRVYVDSLPIEAQIRYWQESALAEIGAGCREFDLAGYQMRKGQDAMAELLRRQRAALAAHGLRMQYEEHYGGRGYTEALGELAEALGVPTMTLYRWERGYAARGLAGIARKGRCDAGQSRSMCLLARDYVEFLLCDQRKPSQNYVMEKVQKRAEEMGEEGCDMCPYRANSGARLQALDDGQELPVCAEAGQGMIPPDSRHAVNRAVALISKSVLAYARYGSRSWDAKYQQKLIRVKPEQVNAVWFGDHHECDVMVLDRDGRVVRPWLTAWMDAKTSALPGWVLTLNPNSDTIADALERGALPTVGSEMYGLPMVAYMDNGKDYRSHRFEGTGEVVYDIGKLNTNLYENKGLLEVLGVEAKRAIPFSAWTKPIERLFGVLEDRWMRDFPGWCGGSWKERPQDLAKEIKRLVETGGLMTFETFAGCFRERVIEAYHNCRSEEDGKTPLERYRAGEKARKDMPTRELMAVLKMHDVQRKVQTQGVSLGGVRYQDVALGPLIGEWVNVKYNRGEPDSVAIFHRGHWVCEAERADTMNMIERDREKLSAAMETKGKLRGRITGRIQRIEQNVRGTHREAYAEEIDEQRSQALATVGNIEAHKSQRAKADMVKRRRARKGELDEGARRVDDMMLRRGEAAIRRAQEG